MLFYGKGQVSCSLQAGPGKKQGHAQCSAGNSLHPGGGQVHRGCRYPATPPSDLESPRGQIHRACGGPWDGAVLPGHLIISLLILFQEPK